MAEQTPQERLAQMIYLEEIRCDWCTQNGTVDDCERCAAVCVSLAAAILDSDVIRESIRIAKEATDG